MAVLYTSVLVKLLGAKFYEKDMEFNLPEAKWGSGYRTVFDSAKSVINYEPRLALPNGKVTLAAHSMQIWFVNRD